MKNKQNFTSRVLNPATFPVGGQWYTAPENFWKWRAIFHPDGLDFVPDRGGFSENGFNENRKSFLVDIFNSKAFKSWVKDQSGNSSEIFAASLDGLEFRASNNRSYGYMYLWAYENQKEDLTPF